MSALDEQLEEVEVLGSIFPECFTLISNSSPVQYNIKLVPNSEGDSDNHVGITLICNIPADYPNNAAPQLTLQMDKGLTKVQMDELNNLANNTALDNLGSPSIFIIAEELKQWLIGHNVAGQDGSMYADMMRRMQAKDTEEKRKIAIKEDVRGQKVSLSGVDEDGIAIDVEEIERLRKRALGTLVTAESFAQWKKKFDAEAHERVCVTGIPAAVASGSYVPVYAKLEPAPPTSSGTRTVYNFTQEIIPPSANAPASAVNTTTDAIVYSGKQLFLMKKLVEYDGSEEPDVEADEVQEEESEEDEDYDPNEEDESESDGEDAPSSSSPAAVKVSPFLKLATK